MDNSMLKKFASKQRELLLADSDEPTAYFGFMRLCAMAYADRTALDELCSAPSERPCALFAEKCRQLADRYGGIFSLYSELPVPPTLLAVGGTAGALRELPQEIWDEPDILGKFHQYFNEPYRSEIAVGLKRSKRLSSDKIAAATQLFTPEWVVRYMVQNTLGRYLREHGFDINRGELEFTDIKADKGKADPEKITFIDGTVLRMIRTV